MALRAAVLGASGFAGAELLRLLDSHPAIDVVAAAASSQAGKQITDVFPGLASFAGMAFCSFEEALNSDAEVLFSSLPHGQSSRVLPDVRAGAMVDLAGDFRLHDPGIYAKWYGEPHPEPSRLGGWVYGLTEFHRDEIAGRDDPGKGGRPRMVANPGCYAAASILAAGPLLESGLVDGSHFHISAMSGVSGAGRAQGRGFEFVSANENVRAYRPTGHNHIGEIEQELSLLARDAVKVSFVPHLVPMNRGIFLTAAIPVRGHVTEEQLTHVLNERYQQEPFVRVLEPPALPETKRLSGSNFAEVAATFDARTGTVLAFAAIDNLGKGAAGQAVQNANLMLGLDETTGLLGQALTP